MRSAGAAAAAALALAVGLAACGDDGGDDRAKTFRDRSTALCREVVRDAEKAAADFERSVDDVARSGDPEALRQELLGFLEDLDGALRPYFERSKGVLPPDDAEAWETLQDRALVAYDRVIERSRTSLEEAKISTVEDLDELLGELQRTGEGVDDLTVDADPVYRRYGVRACLSQNLGAGLN